MASGIAVEHMDKSIHPGDDFFSYMNGVWIEQAEIPADKASYGGFAILRDESQANVRAIIEESASGDFAKGTDEQKVGDLYKSYLDLETRNEKGVSPLAPELERIESIDSYDDLAVYFASAIKRGYGVPFVLGQYADMKNPEYYMIYTWQAGLGLPEREYYFNEDENSAEIRDKYVAHIATMFDLAGLSGGQEAAKTIMALETRMADAHMKKELARDFAANYSKIPLNELGGLMPNFNWEGYIAEAGIGDIDGLVVMMNDHMSALDEIIVETDLDTWRTYLAWVALNGAAGRLDEQLDNQNFEFYGKTLSGTEEQRPMWRRAVNTVNGSLGEVVGKVYVKEYFPPEAKQRMETLVANLILAYEKSIKELDWMSDETKAEALDKLSKFRPKIGYPDEWREYEFDIEVDDLFGNLERATVAEYERQLARQGGPVDRGEWGMTPQTVNAYYSPALNEIVFPAAILQPPFFNLEADDAVNYGAIGAVIGHEIGHGFDDKGSTFDGDGVLRNWWTEEDRAKFEERTGKLVAQYSAFAPFDDLNVNGEFTLGENIGDLGGVSIGLLAYKMSLEGKEAPVIDGFTGVQRVFLGYGQVWRNKYRDEALRQLIQTDPHSPSMYRANGAVRNVPEWYEAFDVTEAHALYLPPEERVKIW
ncbi:MAG: peptidase M13 [Gammaproteobacteria bacterium]|nr:peptidase M13 [Gammaproteobacteria bacterium]NNC56848.1 peptidase M13 [Woeseiaceae bacterium]NNL50221.1 peptidase M13 [Woeseiaceae bacterium]